MSLTMMQLVGYTAGFDAVLALASWFVVRARTKKPLYRPSEIVTAFTSYLWWTVAFLALTAVAMLLLTGTRQAVVVLVSDLFLWVALYFFIRLAAVGRSGAGFRVATILFWVAAAAGTLYQVAGLLGWPRDFGPAVTYVLANIAPLLMYAVWVPSALLFAVEASRTSDRLAKHRLWLLAAGLLLTTYSWAWRLLAVTPSVWVIVGSSLLGFVLILLGVLYRRS